MRQFLATDYADHQLEDLPIALTGIHTVRNGERFLGSEIRLALLETVLHACPSALELPASPLSRHEQEVLQLVAEGFTNQQIVDQLFANRRAVETHRRKMLEKTGRKNTAALIIRASTHQLLGS